MRAILSKGSLPVHGSHNQKLLFIGDLADILTVWTEVCHSKQKLSFGIMSLHDEPF